MTRSGVARVGIVTVFALAGARAAAGQQVAIVAEIGDTAPPPSGPATFAALGDPRIGSAGTVAFAADLSDGTTNHTVADESIWIYAGGSLTLLVREGQPAPDTEANTVFATFADSRVVVTAAGEVAFSATLANPVTPLSAANNQGFWAGTPGSLRKLARAGDSTPGIAGQTFNTSLGFAAPPSFTEGAQGFRGQQAPSSQQGIWAGLASPLALVIRAQQPAPHDPTFTPSSFQYPVTNRLGVLAFTAVGGVSRILLGSSAATLTNFVKSGDSPPPAGLQITLNTSTPIGINDSNQLAFHSSLTATGEDALWVGTPSDLRVVAHQHQQVPGAEAGVTFASFALDPILINGLGAALFEATFTGAATGGGLFVRQPGGAVQMLTRSDRPLPGLSGNAGNMSAWSINTGGEIAFEGTGFWRGSPGAVQLVALNGMSFDAGPKGTRTYGALMASTGGGGNQDGRPSFLSDTGQFVYRAIVNPGSHTSVLLSPAANPAPALPRAALLALSLALAAAVVLLGRRAVRLR